MSPQGLFCNRGPRQVYAKYLPHTFQVANGSMVTNCTNTYHGVLHVWVKVIYLAPSAYSCLRVPRLALMACPPSTPIREAMRSPAFSMSETEVAKVKADGYFSTNSFMMSIWSRNVRVASLNWESQGMYADQNWKLMHKIIAHWHASGVKLLLIWIEQPKCLDHLQCRRAS